MLMKPVFLFQKSGLRKMIRDLRRTKVALGDGKKRTYPGEVGPIGKMSKKIVANKDMPKGWVLREEDVCFKSPGDGVPPYMMGKFINYPLMVDVKKDDDIDETVML